MSELTIRVDNAANGNYYTWFRYPKGELQVRLTDVGIEACEKATNINVIADISSSDDIMKVLLLRDALRGLFTKRSFNETPNINLILPYLPYSRADRRFTVGDCCGISVFFNTLALYQWHKVITLDVHNSSVATVYCGGTKLTDIAPYEPMMKAVYNFAEGKKDVVVLFPDEGARKRYIIPAAMACNTAEIKITVLNCSKKRDPETGKLSGFNVPAKEEFPEGANVIIVDDICDGGGTFVGIADALKDYNLRLGLYVTHGIFSQGFDKLGKAFSNIYTTNSITRDDSGMLTVYDCFPELLKAAFRQ